MKHLSLIAALPLALAAPLAAQEEEPVTPASIVAASSPDEWVEIDPDDILIMRLADDGSDKPRDVVIQLIPPPFSQPWVENIRTLARAHWWDGTSVYRVVDNWVTQWGDVSEEKPLPEGVVSPDERYTSVVKARDPLDPASFDPPFTRLPVPDPYTGTAYDSEEGRIWMGGVSGISQGWPVALVARPTPKSPSELEEMATGSAKGDIWPIHCYGHVGVARDLESTGTGSELYAVIGHAPRQLDRNIAVVGRVIEGMEHLSTLRRGTGEAGVYESRDEDTPIEWVRLASDEEESEHWRYEYLDTGSDSFAAYVQSRANRNDDFYTVPAGGVDVCNVQVPIRWIDPEGEG